MFIPYLKTQHSVCKASSCLPMLSHSGLWHWRPNLQQEVTKNHCRSVQRELLVCRAGYRIKSPLRNKEQKL